MSAQLTQAILELAEGAGEAGVPMGLIVDRLSGDGLSVDQIEREMWTLLQRRRLTPAGFICRTVKRRDKTGTLKPVRMYELMLVPWSPTLDGQLDLDLNNDP